MDQSTFNYTDRCAEFNNNYVFTMYIPARSPASSTHREAYHYYFPLEIAPLSGRLQLSYSLCPCLYVRHPAHSPMDAMRKS